MTGGLGEVGEGVGERRRREKGEGKHVGDKADRRTPHRQTTEL